MTQQEDPSGHIRLSASWRERCENPPTFSELREFFTLMTQQHFSNSLDYGDDHEDMKCLVYNQADPDKSELPVRAAFGNISISSNTGVRVMMQGMNFTPVTWLENSFSEDNATIYSVTKMVSALKIVIDHPVAEIAQKLAESVAIFFQATRPMWQNLYHIETFQLREIAPTTKTINEPEGIHQVIVSFSLQASLILALTEESLILKKIQRTVVSTHG